MKKIYIATDCNFKVVSVIAAESKSVATIVNTAMNNGFRDIEEIDTNSKYHPDVIYLLTSYKINVRDLPCNSNYNFILTKRGL